MKYDEVIKALKHCSTEKSCSLCPYHHVADCFSCMARDVLSILETQTAPNTAGEQDVVNHPSHYETGKFECIEVMEEALGKEAVMGFCVCNAFKYLYRHRRKNGVEDIKKSRWYVDKYVELSERE